VRAPTPVLAALGRYMFGTLIRLTELSDPEDGCARSFGGDGIVVLLLDIRGSET
jgi:hypothetical protein